jgi:hypothetical protein
MQLDLSKQDRGVDVDPIWSLLWSKFQVATRSLLLCSDVNTICKEDHVQDAAYQVNFAAGQIQVADD